MYAIENRGSSKEQHAIAQPSSVVDPISLSLLDPDPDPSIIKQK
jgi:hypothetical protein